jgi:hypothetical protein
VDSCVWLGATEGLVAGGMRLYPLAGQPLGFSYAEPHGYTDVPPRLAYTHIERLVAVHANHRLGGRGDPHQQHQSFLTSVPDPVQYL